MLDVIDIIIIAAYLIGTITIGIICRGKQENADDYFTASGRMRSSFQSLLVGLSIAATLFSGISFLSYPSMSYSHGVILLLSLISLPISMLVFKYWFLPRFLTGNVKHPYDVIENRFGPGIRKVAAAMYMLLRIGWMAALIYAPTIAILAAANLDDSWFWPIVLIIGLCSTFYTAFGGIQGVIVTDAIQFVVFFLGILLTIIFILVKLPVSFSQILQHLQTTNHLTLLDFSIDPTKLFTFWSCFFGHTIATISIYIADQMSLQRYLAAGSQKSAVRSFNFNILGVMLVIIMLVIVGLCLSAWFHFIPDPNLPINQDKVFPYFIATQLPVGIAGLLLAAILAATISSMTSGINILSATVTIDFCMRSGLKMTPRGQLLFARIVCLVVGLLATLAAGLVERIGTIFDITQTLLGLFLGPLLTCITAAVIKKPVSRISLCIGMLAGIFAGGLVTWSDWVSLWVAPVGFGVSFIITILGTFIIGADKVKEPSCE